MITDIEDLILFLQVFHSARGEHQASYDITENLPHALTRLYTEFGTLIDLLQSEDRPPFGTQDYLIPVKDLKYIDGMCEFAGENQDNWFCRFPLNENDPPVYSNSMDLYEEGPNKGFVPVCKSLEHF